MKNDPALGRPYRYEIDAALKRLQLEEERRERTAEEAYERQEALRAFYQVRRDRAYSIGKHVLLWMISATILAGMFGWWLIEKLAQAVGY